jgi:ATP phosphoribosyltransferase regulatory subunit HisZ
MLFNDLESQLFKLNFTLVGVPEYTGSKTIYAYSDEQGLEAVRVTYDHSDKTVTASSGKRSFTSTLDSDLIIQNVLELIEEVDKIDPPTEDDLKAAKLIREVKTLRLRPQDRLAVVIKNHEELNLTAKTLNDLRETMLRWIGEKNSGRVMILLGDIELTKISRDDVESN